MNAAILKSVSWSMVALAVALVPGAVAIAELPVARLTTIFPPGGQAGSTVEVAVTGAHLDDPATLLFSHPGITAASQSDTLQFNVAIATNVPPGFYDARFVGRFGVSNPRTFVVGLLPESILPPTNTAAASAATLKGDLTINSRVSPNAIAWFKFEARPGQRFFAECLARSIDSRMDAMVTVCDAMGHEFDRQRTGGVVDFTAPRDGSYLLKVADFLYRGGDDYFYRLTLSGGPRVDFVLPAAGLPGTRTQHTVYGRHLPGGEVVKGLTLDGRPVEQLDVEIQFPALDSDAIRRGTGVAMPAAAVLGGFEYRLETAPAASPVWLSAATAPVVREREPNDRPEQAQVLTPPCEVSGQFYPADNPDWFKFEAKKGEVFWLEVFSHRLGLPTDPFVLVQRVAKDDQGAEQASEVQELQDSDANVGDREFNTSTRDPIGRFEAKEAGLYRLQVRDLFNRASASPRHIYRLSIRREQPDFRLVAMSIAPREKADAKNVEIGVPFLRRGETVAVRVMALRRDGFNGDIDLTLDDPPRGLIFAGDRIDAGKSTDTILLTAAEDAPAWSGPVNLVGRARVGDQTLVRRALGGTLVHGVASTDSERPEGRLAREFALGISDREFAPITLTAAENRTWEVAAGTKLQIPLRITRRGDFNATLKLKPLGPGQPEALKEFDVDGKATDATFNLDPAALKLSPGTHVFALQTQTTGKYRNNPEAAALAEAAAKTAEQAAKDAAAAAKTAAEEAARAEKAATAAEAAAKEAAARLATAKDATEKDPGNEGLVAARTEAEKAATESAARSKAASETKATAATAAAAAEAKAKETQAQKESTARIAKAAAEKAKARDATVTVYSAPIKVRITPAQVPAK